MPGCRVCRSRQLQFITDFGHLSITNQFFTEHESLPYRQSISWQECQHCGVVQLSNVPPVEQIRPRYSWIHYAEPEGHLDETAQILQRVFPIESGHQIVGFTADDRALLKRLSVGSSRLLDPLEQLGLSQEDQGMGSVQAAWTVERAAHIAAQWGPADVLVARYALEHCHDAAEFLAACRQFLSPDGCLLIEVPDSAAAIRDVDVTVVWEEHTLYFTERTLIHGLGRAGFDTLHLQRVPDAFEDRLVWIGRRSRAPEATMSAAYSHKKEPDLRAFAESWPRQREALRAWAAAIIDRGGRLAVFGAGHRACTLIDIMDLAEFIDCVIDDSPEKQKLRFPAGGLAIRGSRALIDHQITCCLMVVNPAAEQRIVDRNPEYLETGGKFVSLYPRSPRVLRLP